MACTATDASGNPATGSFTVHVRGAGEQIDDLQRVLVVITDIPRSMRQSLGAKLASAEASLGDGDVEGAWPT